MADMVACEASLSTDFSAVPADVKARVLGYSGELLDSIETLASQVQGLRDQAEDAFAAAADFGTFKLPDVRLTAALSAYKTLPLSVPDAPSLTTPSAPAGSVIGQPPSLTVDTLNRSTLESPPDVSLQFPDAPITPGLGGAPQPLPDVAFPALPDVPDYAPDFAGLPVLGSVPELRLPEISTRVVTALPLVQMPDAPEAPTNAAVHTMAWRKFRPDAYSYQVLPDALGVAAAVLDGGLGDNAEALDAVAKSGIAQAAHAHTWRVRNLWSRRGLEAPPRRQKAVDGYAAALLDRYAQDADDAVRAARLRLRMRSLPAILQTITQAHAGMAEIRAALYEADFAMLVAEQDVQARVVAASVDQMQSDLTTIKLRVAEYEAQVVQVKAETDAHRVATMREIAKARANQAVASGYSAAVDAIGAQVRAYEARYRAAAAVVEAYGDLVQSVASRALQAEASVLKFNAQSEQWAAQVAQAQARFRLVRAQNQAVVAQNQALAARVSGDAVAADVVAAESNAAATEVASEVAQLRATLQQRIAQYTQIAANNGQIGAVAGVDALNAQLSAVKFSAAAQKQSVDYAALSAVNETLGTTASNIISAAISTAQNTFRNRAALADAYVDMYRTLADAEAARLAGRASGIRADVRLATRGAVDYGSDVSKRVDSQYSARSSKSAQCLTVFRPLQR